MTLVIKILKGAQTRWVEIFFFESGLILVDDLNNVNRSHRSTQPDYLFLGWVGLNCRVVRFLII